MTVQSSHVPPRSATDEGGTLTAAYDGSNVTFRVLRAYGVGPLMNFGYFRFPPPLTLLNLVASSFVLAPQVAMPPGQVRLVHKAMALLKLAGGHGVLDVACGRGATSYMMAGAFPQLQVTGIDLLPENLAAARTLYGSTANLSYRDGDAMQLDFADRSFDRVLCMEAAFHFADRAQFLSELSRVTSAGGRAVIVDFMWTSDAARQQCRGPDNDLVKSLWHYKDFSSIDEYKDNARRSGFTVAECVDWTGHVTAPILTLFDVLAVLARWAWGRALLVAINPLIKSLSNDDWRNLIVSARAHRSVHKHARYIALVLTR